MASSKRTSNGRQHQGRKDKQYSQGFGTDVGSNISSLDPEARTQVCEQSNPHLVDLGQMSDFTARRCPKSARLGKANARSTQTGSTGNTRCIRGYLQ